MYVIFPADEVVYLSYGRLIYVPLSPSTDSRSNIPIRTTSLEATEIEISSPSAPSTSTDPKSKRSSNSEASTSSKPGPSNSGSLDRPKNREKKPEQNPSPSSKSNKGKLPQKTPPGLETPPKSPERAFNSNSNKSSKSSKHSSSSSKSRSQPSGSKEKVTAEPSTSAQLPIRDRTSSDSANNATPPKPNKLKSSSFRSFLRPSSNRDKTPEPPPLRPERKKDKKALKLTITKPKSPLVEKKPSYPDLSAVIRDKIEIPRSEIINTRSDRVQSVRVERPPIKREKSPVLRFFRAKSASPRNSPRDRHSVDFDDLFKRDASPGKLSVSSVPYLQRAGGSGSNLAGQQNSPSSGESSARLQLSRINPRRFW